ncbi:hypothetical protein [Streptomyces sp. SCSIO ZS0520]|uniref:hypothetical protein n=1 Tax=Streptomyces sp. SCSIO ZS0520 TaxID=2892996 RepID=UPI0021D7EC6A|nr:hypothetical protein [Streptomyces sp. SCSIO ZS0520]
MKTHRDALCTWAVANGLDPRQIAQQPITIRPHGNHTVIEYRAFVLDKQGRHQLDPQHQHQALTTTRTTRLTRALAEFGLDPDQLGTPPHA